MCTGFRYIFLLITASSRFFSAYRISVQLSSDRYLFPDPPCVPDSGTTFFQSLPVSGSVLRTGFRYNFFLIAVCSWILPAYRISVQLSSSHCLFPVLLCVPDFGTAFFRLLPLPGFSLRTGFRYIFLPIAASSRIFPNVPDSGTFPIKKKPEHSVQISSLNLISQPLLCIASYSMQFHILIFFEFHAPQSIPCIYYLKFVLPPLYIQNPTSRPTYISLQ